MSESYTLVETDEARRNREEYLSTQILPAIRAGMLAIPLVVATAWLFHRWGTKFPNIDWSIPAVLPALHLFACVIYSRVPVTYTFSDSCLRQKTGMRGKTVYWASVKNWEVVPDPRDKNTLILKVSLTWGRSETVIFHRSYGKEKIESLVRQYGKI